MIQIGKTKQDADADATAKQKALNANVPLLIVGGDPSGGSSSASQDVSNKADADASNRSKTDQDATATQTGGKSDCWSGCGGNGQEQNVVQIGKTKQHADADAKAKQKALNANVPVDISGKAVSGGSSSADQTAHNKADADASNKSKTDQDAHPTQSAGSSMCGGGCGGHGQEQNVLQKSKTHQRGHSQGTGTTGGDQPLDTVLKEQAPAGADRFRSDRRAAAACRSGTSLQPDAPRGTVHRRLEVCSDDDMIETTFDIRFSAGDDDCVIASNVTGETEQQAELVAFAHYVARAISLLGPARAGGVVEELARRSRRGGGSGAACAGSRRLQSSRCDSSTAPRGRGSTFASSRGSRHTPGSLCACCSPGSHSVVKTRSCIAADSTSPRSCSHGWERRARFVQTTNSTSPWP